jgi:hypothetical protein
LLADGDVMTIDAPQATATAVIGINDRGDMVGEYDASPTGGSAFILSDGRFRDIAVPFPSTIAGNTAAHGIADSGEVVGSYQLTGGLQRGFIAVPTHRRHHEPENCDD